MSGGRHVPERGDIVWLHFDPRVGSSVFCPVTSRIKDYPFEVLFPDGFEVEDAVLADQLKSLDWRARRAKRLARAPNAVLRETLGKIQALVGER